MIAIVHSIYSQSVHAPALDAGLVDNDAERYCTVLIAILQWHIIHILLNKSNCITFSLYNYNEYEV